MQIQKESVMCLYSVTYNILTPQARELSLGLMLDLAGIFHSTLLPKYAHWLWPLLGQGGKASKREEEVGDSHEFTGTHG